MRTETNQVNQNTSQEQAPPQDGVVKSENQVIDDGAEKIFNQQQQNVQNQSQNEKSEETYIYEGFGKKFKTADELAEYTKELESKLVKNELGKKSEEDNQEKPTISEKFGQGQEKSVVTDELADRIFEEPKEVLTELEKKIKDGLKAEDLKKKQEAQFWNEFYHDFPDLKKQERVVNLILKEQGTKIAPMNIDKGREYLASETRTLLRQMGNEMGTKEKLNTGGSDSLGTSGASVPSGAPAQSNSSDFVSEMKAMQRKH